MSDYSPLKPVEDIVPQSCRISLISLIRELYLVPQSAALNRLNSGEVTEYIRQVLGTISNPPTWKVLEYLLERGAISSVIARRRLLIPRRSAFRSLEDLVNLGLIELAYQSKVPSLKGHPGNIYRLVGAPVEAVRDAATLHNLLISSKKYRIADDLAQTILEEFKQEEKKEINESDVVNRIKQLKIPYSVPDVSQAVCRILRDNGLRISYENNLKVWR